MSKSTTLLTIIERKGMLRQPLSDISLNPYSTCRWALAVMTVMAIGPRLHPDGVPFFCTGGAPDGSSCMIASGILIRNTPPFLEVELFGDANVFLAGQAIDTFRRIVTAPMVESPTTSIWDRDACPGVHHLVLKRVCLSPVLWASFHKLTKGEDAYPNERAGYAQLLAFCLEYLSKCWVNGSTISVPPRLAIGKRLDRILSELEASDRAFEESITEAYPVGPDNRSSPEVLKDQLLDEEQVQWCKNSILRDTTEAERNAGRAAELRDLGNCTTRAKKYEHALSCYEYSLQWNNSEPLTYSNMALCNLKLCRWADAVSAADSAIARDDTIVKAWYRKSVALFKMLSSLDEGGERESLQSSLRLAVSKARDLGCEESLLADLRT
ncbi:Sperm associated antigen 1 [Perkinsus olseni]|uniref:Sperm associated antigen 1 n=1 Tax=Perkinsus olseni TaxID=32597 RepID=A0A7J6MF47_PEROL|nr:Sperm associated antigen 1 [Perkinsus olseni]